MKLMRRSGNLLNFIFSTASLIVALSVVEMSLRLEERWYIVESSKTDSRTTAPVPNAQAYRILGLGDSFTFGQGVKDADTYLRQLEVLLQARYPRKFFQTINLGVPGYNTAQEYQMLLHRGLAYKPDLIIVGFTLSDPETVQDYLWRTRKINAGPSSPRGITLTTRLRDFVNRSYLYQFAKPHAIALMVRLRLISDDPAASYYKSLYSENYRGWLEAQNSLKAMKQVAEEKRSHFLVVIFPFITRLDASYPFDGIHKRVSDFCMSNGIEVLDLLPDFMSRDARKLRVSLLDHHPNAEAHRIAAEVILRFVISRNWVGGSRQVVSDNGTKDRRHRSFTGELY